MPAPKKQHSTGRPLLRVKFLGNYSVKAWLRQFPGGTTIWGDCLFIFDEEAGDYDWLVVYNDFPGNLQEVCLSSPEQRTMLITMEPPSIKTYGRHYTAQFDYVLTAQPAWALPHRNRIYSQCALQWFYGCGSETVLSYNRLQTTPALEKSRQLSTVCSTKQQRHTLHNQRYKFTQELKLRIPEMAVFGHGVIEMDDKAEALDAYRYHLAIENYIGRHHWTEKLADVFLGAALPFYCGCPNTADYFPVESFIPIDIGDVDAASEIIQKAIRDREYEKRLPYILEARRRVLEEYNMFAVLARELPPRTASPVRGTRSDSVLSRRLLRKRHPLVAVSDVLEKSKVRICHHFLD